MRGGISRFSTAQQNQLHMVETHLSHSYNQQQPTNRRIKGASMKTLPFSLLVWLLAILALLVSAVQAQTTNATVNGLVVDSSGAVVVGASVQAINDGTNVAYPTVTNKEGVYALTNLPPGRYHIQVARAGFKTLIKPDIILNVLDAHGINFTLQVGAASETVTVEGGAPLVNTQDATVSTVVDRQFAENLPLNGRSFQSLIQLCSLSRLGC